MSKLPDDKKKTGNKFLDKAQPSEQSNEFPLEVVKTNDLEYGPGFYAKFFVEGSEESIAIAPGGTAYKQRPYWFQRASDAWSFVAQINKMAGDYERARKCGSQQPFNCGNCNTVFRYQMSPYCNPCLMDSADTLTGFGRLIYHQTGSTQTAYQRLSLILNLPEDKIQSMMIYPLERRVYPLSGLHADLPVTKLANKEKLLGANTPLLSASTTTLPIGEPLIDKSKPFVPLKPDIPGENTPPPKSMRIID